MKLGSLFDGIGGFPLVASRYKIKPVWASEIEPFPIKVTQKHFPNMKHLGDITQVNGAEIEPVDIITFGSPCQDLSVAGKREGLQGERSGLFMDAVRIIREMRRASGGEYPRFIVWENVPGAFSSNKGEDFRAVLEEIAETEIPMPRSGKWANAGMVRTERIDIAWRTLDAQYWGVPQRRKRIFLVADFTGQCAGEILFESEGLRGDTAESGEKREEIAGAVGDSFKKSSTIKTNAGAPRYKEDLENSTLKPWIFDSYNNSISEISTSLGVNCGMSTGRSIACTPSKDNQPATDLVIEPRSADGVPRWNTEGIVPTLNTAQGGQRQPCVISIQNATRGKSQNGLGVSQDNVSYTLDSLGNHAVCIQGSMISREDKNGPQGDGVNEEVRFTLNTIDRHAVAFACNQRDEVRDMKDKSGALQVQPGMKQQTFVATKVYGICSDGSNSMKSDNPHSGIYEAETTRTLDQNGGNPACNQGGMAIVQCIEPGALSRGQGERVWDKCPTLRAKMGDNQPCVVLNDQGGSQMDVSENVVGTLRAEMHGNIPAVTTYSFQRSDAFKETDKASTQSRRQYKDATDLVCSVDCRNFNETGKHGTLQAKGNGGQSLNYMGAVREGYSVRRLTPLECERLQGFPDGWTDIPGQTEASKEELEFWRDVWLTWDKTRAENPEKVEPRTDKAILKWLKNPTSDSAQYKALGNSVAIPCVESVLGGIVEALSCK